jgi:hypothetical protein
VRLGYGFRDGGVETAVEDFELLDGDRRLLFDGNLGHGLADVSVVVNDLRHAEPKLSSSLP